MGSRVYIYRCHHRHDKYPEVAGQSAPVLALESMPMPLVIQLELTLDDIKWAIVAAKKLKIKQEVSPICNRL